MIGANVDLSPGVVPTRGHKDLHHIKRDPSIRRIGNHHIRGGNLHPHIPDQGQGPDPDQDPVAGGGDIPSIQTAAPLQEGRHLVMANDPTHLPTCSLDLRKGC